MQPRECELRSAWSTNLGRKTPLRDGERQSIVVFRDADAGTRTLHVLEPSGGVLKLFWDDDATRFTGDRVSNRGEDPKGYLGCTVVIRWKQRSDGRRIALWVEAN